MAAQQSADTTTDARASRASPRPGGRRRPAVRRVVHGVLFVALAAGVFGLLPRLGGHLTPFGSAAGTLVNVGTLEADGIEAATTGEAIALTSLMSTVALDQGALPGHGQAAAGAAG